MKRILFVDDEPRVLDGLRRALFTHRRHWDMVFSDSPEKAQELLPQQAFDVVVSDMRMPGMDGTQLLDAVLREQPAALRVILSGQSDMEATVRTAVVAHQFISKPCEPAVLNEVLARTLSLHEILGSVELRALVSRLPGLPSPPRIYQQLSVTIAQPEVDLDVVSGIVEQDLGLCAKLLQLVNSSFYALAQQVASVRQAVGILGLDRIKSVVLSSEIYRQFDASELPRGFLLEAEMEHAHLTARIARRLLPDRCRGEFAYLAGMLHDLGKWILAVRMPSSYEKLYDLSIQLDCTFDEVEERVARLPHSRLGGYLLGIWGLPYPVIEAVLHHHHPGDAGAASFDVLGAVHVADCLSQAARTQDPSERERLLCMMDRAFLERTGGVDRMDSWLALAEEEVARAA